MSSVCRPVSQSQLWFVAAWGRTESSVMDLPVHGLVISTLHIITVAPCI